MIFPGEFIKPERIHPETSRTYRVSPMFIKGIYRLLIRGGKMIDVNAEFSELDAFYSTGYEMDINMQRLFIKHHIYDEYSAKYARLKKLGY